METIRPSNVPQYLDEIKKANKILLSIPFFIPSPSKTNYYIPENAVPL